MKRQYFLSSPIVALSDAVIHTYKLDPNVLIGLLYSRFSHLCFVDAMQPVLTLIIRHLLQSYVTHALKVENLRGIEVVPAKLESTTLIFAYGIDLFFSRLAPSRTYDSLTEDFSYALLLITIVALVVAIFVTWILSERKELQEKWRWIRQVHTSQSKNFTVRLLVILI